MPDTTYPLSMETTVFTDVENFSTYQVEPYSVMTVKKIKRNIAGIIAKYCLYMFMRVRRKTKQKLSVKF